MQKIMLPIAKIFTLCLVFCCLSANAQTVPKKKSVAIETSIATRYDALDLAAQTLTYYIKNADTIRTGDRKRKINTYIFFYLKENIDFDKNKIKKCLIWNKNKEIFTKNDAFPLEINKSDTIKYRFIEIVVQKDSVMLEKKQKIALYFNTLTYFRKSKKDKMECVDTPPDCDPETVKTGSTKRITQTPIQCLNLDAYFIFNKKTKKWLINTDFDRNIERRTWFLKRFLF